MKTNGAKFYKRYRYFRLEDLRVSIIFGKQLSILSAGAFDVLGRAVVTLVTLTDVTQDRFFILL